MCFKSSFLGACFLRKNAIFCFDKGKKRSYCKSKRHNVRNFGEIRRKSAISVENQAEASNEVFKSVFGFVFKYEKGIKNSQDNLLRSKDGITQKLYDNYRRRNGKKPRAIDDIDFEEVFEIYEYFYWRKYDCEKLPSELSVVYFDSICQLGNRVANNILQRSLGLNQTGLLNAATIKKSHSIHRTGAIVLFLKAHERTINEMAESNSFIKKEKENYARRRKELKEFIRRRLCLEKGVSPSPALRFENIRWDLKKQARERNSKK